jgi:signal transduction histidine kinase
VSNALDPAGAVNSRGAPRALIVDDDADDRRLVARILRSAHFDVAEASSGRQALEMARENPDLIVLDARLSIVDGFDVVRALRQDVRTMLIPILHLSATHTGDEERVFGFDDGADAYLTHPIEPSVFLATIRTLLRARAIEQERAGLLAAAQRARAEAESANRAKSEFLATMSHEIRTPINAILGYAQILDMGIAGSVSPEQRLQLDRLRRSAAHLLTLVNELLDLGKVESGRMRIVIEQLPIEDVIEDALAIARPQALARAIPIEKDQTSGRGIRFVGDSGRVRQILVNLLSNAVKFSAAGSPIELWADMPEAPANSSLTQGQAYVAVHIRDSGIGVSDKQLASIFEPFVQGESGPTRTRGGSGLGLAISRRLARLMGGDITVVTEGGHGSLFTLWIPAAPDQPIVVTAEHPASKRQQTAFDPTVLAQLGRLVVTEALNVGHAVAARLRTDEEFPSTAGLADGQLVDHIPAYVTDVGLALSIVAEVGVEASALLHDGNAIRTEIAERHGAQRRRLGWSPPHIEREYEIVLEEIERVLRARDGSTEQQLFGALELIGRLVDQSKTASIRGHREAGGTED